MLNLQQIVRGMKTSEFWVVLFILLGLDIQSGTALYSVLPDSLQVLGKLSDVATLRTVVSDVQYQTWQMLAVKSCLGAIYIYIRDRNRQRSFELDKMRIERGLELLPKEKDENTNV